MKLAYISHWRFPSEKTMSPLIMRTCAEFAQLGVDVELVIPNRHNADYAGVNPYEFHGVSHSFSIKHLPSFDVSKWFSGDWTFLLMLLTFNVSVFLYALRHRDCVFYIHDPRDAFLLSFLKRSYVLEIHDFYKSKLSFINKRVFNKAQGFVVTNQHKIDVIRRQFGIAPEKFLHKPNAVDIEMFATTLSKEDARLKLGLQTDKKIAVYAGHLFDWKGVDTLLDAHVHLPDWQIIFVGGTDEDIESMRKKALALGASNAHFLGRKLHQEIPLYYSAADVLVLPNTAKMDVSKYETSPVKLFEYMASGRPIVASDIPSIRNVVTEKMVWFFEPDNAANLAEQVKTAYSEQRMAREKVDAAFAEVQQHTWKNRINDIKNFIYG